MLFECVNLRFNHCLHCGNHKSTCKWPFFEIKIFSYESQFTAGPHHEVRQRSVNILFLYWRTHANHVNFNINGMIMRIDLVSECLLLMHSLQLFLFCLFNRICNKKLIRVCGKSERDLSSDVLCLRAFFCQLNNTKTDHERNSSRKKQFTKKTVWFEFSEISTPLGSCFFAVSFPHFKSNLFSLCLHVSLLMKRKLNVSTKKNTARHSRK